MTPLKNAVNAVRKGPPLENHSPSVYLPMRFVLSGLVFLLIGVGGLLARPEILATYHYNQHVIAITHVFVLGWIGSVVMGSLYQLVPVALETTLFSERLARWHFLFHVIGVLGMVSMFWVWNIKQVGHFGSAFGLGVVLLAYNIGRTLARIPRWNIVAVGIASALGWLVLTMLMGLFLAASKAWNLNFFDPLAQMHAHAHAGVVGFFLMMTVTISFKLVPMFTLSEIQSQTRTWTTVVILNLGLLGAFSAILLNSPWKFVFALLLLVGLLIYSRELMAILKARKRRTLDWGLRYFLTALTMLGPTIALGLVLAWPGLPLTSLTGQLENAYGFLALLAVLSFAILGMLYKIVPFLVWYARYSKEIGLNKVPALSDLYSPRVQAWGYWLFVTGLVATTGAIIAGSAEAVRFSSALIAASLIFFTLNMGRILSHLRMPRAEAVAIKAPRAAVIA